MSEIQTDWIRRGLVTILIGIVGFFLIDTHKTLKTVADDAVDIKISQQQMKANQENIVEDIKEIKSDVKKNTSRIQSLEQE